MPAAIGEVYETRDRTALGNLTGWEERRHDGGMS